MPAKMTAKTRSLAPNRHLHEMPIISMSDQERLRLSFESHDEQPILCDVVAVVSFEGAELLRRRHSKGTVQDGHRLTIVTKFKVTDIGEDCVRGIIKFPARRTSATIEIRGNHSSKTSATLTFLE